MNGEDPNLESKDDPRLVLRSLCLLSALCWEQFRLNEWQDTTLRDCDTAEELVQFFVISDSQLQVTRDNSGLLVVTSGITSQLEDLSS